MNNFILRASTVAFVAGVLGSIGCPSGTNLNENSAPTAVSMSCGVGTYLSGTQCIPIPKKTTP